MELRKMTRWIRGKLKLIGAVVAEVFTGRSCSRCTHYRAGECCHPDTITRDECTTSLRPVGFERKEG